MGLIPVKTKQTPQEAVKIPGENAGRETRRHREVPDRLGKNSKYLRSIADAAAGRAQE
jgi:hypothetical protein